MSEVCERNNERERPEELERERERAVLSAVGWGD